MTELTARANGVDIAYDTSGNPTDPALLLVSGLGGQLVDWDPDFIDAFVREGFYVIRYDHRDSGLSAKLDGPAAEYSLSDMADDGIGLLDALGIDRAHVFGASMGGVVVQGMLLEHADRLISACAVMTTTGDPSVGESKPEAWTALMAGGQATTREEIIEGFVSMSKIVSGGGFAFDEAAIRGQATRSYDRMYYPAGPQRHMAAMMAAGDRTEQLRDVKVPTVVIHGEEDPLIGVSGGRALAAAVPDATLVVIPGMGHEFPRGAWDSMVTAFVTNTKRADPAH
jgi:pimeloyl-ACP methyl ester carboxylesterase